MPLLKLCDIGQIYVSEGNTSVGIRGVNLSFERGEFVAVTGKSGAGKSTLLNVISGMDSYEEGELFIEGESTSHYMQPDFEEYREKYISFIFQDYNIIESFTVLENVELALMHIEDKHKRRERALELIRRVGLSSHIKARGSKLSGGQKQRTVIARALAKDSPIILADEPTGNLDSASAREIIELLYEVSRDKLLIVVTHNFDDFADYATRHIRIFDGAVEYDHKTGVVRTAPEKEASVLQNEEKKSKYSDLKKGITLGKSIFCRTPILTAFLCVLLTIGTLGIFMLTAMCGGADALFEDSYMFTHIDGRMVIAKPSGDVITEEELQSLVLEYGADSSLHYDLLLDLGYSEGVSYFDTEEGRFSSVFLNSVYGKDYGDDIVGRYPESAGEVFLYLPISYSTVFGRDEIKTKEIIGGSTKLSVSGIKYFYDNNKTGEILYTEDGFRIATAIYYLENSEKNIKVSVNSPEGLGSRDFYYYNFIPSFAVEEGKIYIDDSTYRQYMSSEAGNDASTLIEFESHYYRYNYYNSENHSYTFKESFSADTVTPIAPDIEDEREFSKSSTAVVIHPSLIVEMTEKLLALSYKQASLFFSDDKAASEAAERLQDAGYIAVPSYTTYEPEPFTAIVTVIASVMLMGVWISGVLFLAFFLNLCSSRALEAFKGDMAIMRSMGISVKVIRIAMYVRMLVSLIPAFVITAILSAVVFLTPTLNGYFTYLYAWQYVLIAIGMILLTVLVTHKQVKRLFSESVKKSLKGGNAK